MPLKIEGPSSTNREVADEIIKSDGDLKKCLASLCHGDFYLLGRLWINALEAVLVGAKICLLPSVKAAKLPEPPQKPPPMKYTDLPLYKSPHYEYKDYLADKEKCPKVNAKLLHGYLLPYVCSLRRSTQNSYCEMKCELQGIKHEVCHSLKQRRLSFKKYMREADNLAMRKAVVILGGATGYYLGSGRGIPRRVLFTGLGTLAAGALCFPKETDEAFRGLVYHGGKIAIAAYNSMCGKDFTLRDRLPCKDDLPPPAKPRKSNVCSSK